MTSRVEPADSERYLIVQNKDATWDGRFVFAVKTTGVFCKPSCAARTPLAHNVEYFDAPQAALAAGYRPCLRCRPTQEPSVGPVWLERVCRFIETSEHEPKLSELASVAGCSASSFQRAFKSALGLTPKAYALALRRERLRGRLRDGISVTRAAYASGYGSSGRLYAEAGDALGMPPRAFKRAGAGETIRYATGSSPFGRMLVARTARGVCAVSLGTDDDTLVAELLERFAGATLSESPELGTELEAIVAMWRTGSNDAGLPLDIRGTAFQHRVWQALRRIPAGETRTYGEVALELGVPDAVRAVGSACAANRLALLVPCHRVWRADGEPGGFRWGLPVKRRLVDAERSMSEAPARTTNGDPESS